MVGVEVCERDMGEESMFPIPHEEDDDGEERWPVGDWLFRESVTSGEDEDEGPPEDEDEVSPANATVSSFFSSSLCFLLGVASSCPAAL